MNDEIADEIDDEKKYWVALSTHIKIGARTFQKLYRRFKKLSKVWAARAEDLQLAGLDLGQIQAVQEVIANKNPDKELEKLQKFGVEVIIYPEKEYPRLLKEISDPPGILYVRGKIIPEDELALAVVGSRKFSSYGERAIQLLVEPLARKNITIVSGLALGIDALAHRAALIGGSRTIAVLGCGLDQIYPVSNIKLADQILQRGAIISEYPLGMPALKQNFPVRNRIIAGLSLGTLVIECAQNSGSLLTAAAALEYNREVFAVPGSIFAETSVGTNRLIKMGAKLTASYEDVLEELTIENTKASVQLRQIIPDSKDEEILLRLLGKQMTTDELIRQSKLSSAVVNSTLMMMEMKGKISNLGGTAYVIRGELKNF